MLDKRIVHNEATAVVSAKYQRIQAEFDALQESLMTETKSSAGDKHETGRAMTQLEQEKLSHQLTETRKSLEGLRKIDPAETFKTIEFGSLVETSRGYFFVSVGIGQLQIEETTVFCVTAGSPIGQQLLRKKKGESIQLNGTIEILDLI